MEDDGSNKAFVRYSYLKYQYLLYLKVKYSK